MNVLSYDGEGKLIRFETYGGEELINRTFPRWRGATIRPLATALGMRRPEERSHGSNREAN